MNISRKMSILEQLDQGDAEYFTQLIDTFCNSKAAEKLDKMELYDDIYNIQLYNFENNRIVIFMKRIIRMLNDEIKKKAEEDVKARADKEVKFMEREKLKAEKILKEALRKQKE